MKNFSESLLKDLELQLKNIKTNCLGDPLENSYQSIIVLLEAMEKLKAFFLGYKCKDESEEIDFFKNIKPKLTSQIIYYNELYNVEINKPMASAKTIRKYYNTELKKREKFFKENLEFYKYYRNGSNHLDNKYFMRHQLDIKLTLDSFCLNTDNDFATSHDYKIALLIANEKLQKYLVETLKKTQKSKYKTHQENTILKWTGSKVGIIELIYALHTEGVFNHGACEIREIVYVFSNMFNIDMGQFHRTFYEISARKSERTKFLNNLKENLLRRMEQTDSY